MKIQIRQSRQFRPSPLLRFLLPCLLSLPVLLSFSGCVGQVAASGITIAAETGAGYALQHKTLTVAQLQQLATDLPGVATGKALSPQDNAILAQFVASLHGSTADLTQVSLIDGLNTQITALNTNPSPTAFQGVLWSNLQDLVAGLNAEVKVAQSNPALVPQ
jgi:hypothetical protein